MDLFEEFKNLYTKQKKVDSSESTKNGYMLNRLLSFDRNHFYYSTEITRLMRRLPKWSIGCLMFHVIAPQRTPWLAYPKAVKPVSRQSLEALKKHFNCSEKYAEQIEKILVRRGLDIHKIFGIKENEKKKNK
jgi:hypothetical protein